MVLDAVGRHHSFCDVSGHQQWHLNQPSDINWWRPKVRDEFDALIRFWLDRSIEGLRIDVAHGIVKDPDLPDLTDGQLDSLHSSALCSARNPNATLSSGHIRSFDGGSLCAEASVGADA